MLNKIGKFSINDSDYGSLPTDIHNEIFLPDIKKIAKLHGFNYNPNNDNISNQRILRNFMNEVDLISNNEGIHPKVEIIIPIIYESHTYHKINYLCIIPKNVNLGVSYITKTDGKINSDISGTDKEKLQSLMVNNKKACTKLFNFNLYYDRNDLNKSIKFDTCLKEFTGRKKHKQSDASTNDYYTILTNDYFSIYSEFGIFMYNEIEGIDFPLVPLNYKDYMITGDIYPVNFPTNVNGCTIVDRYGIDSTKKFKPNCIPYVSENSNIGMGKWTTDFYKIKNYWYCHCYNKIFRISDN